MIVTRQRRRRFPWKRLALPLIAVVLAIVAFTWPPSHNAIANGPAAPLWRAAGAGVGTVTAPMHFAAQNQIISDRNKQIAQLQTQVADAQAKDQAKDKKLSDLQSQVATLQAQAASERGAAAVKPAQGAATSDTTFARDGSASSSQSGSDLSTGATADMRRTAQFWANMEPENAAKVVQHLPVVYVAHVFALMPADAAGSIMDALPATYVAALTQEHPELKR